MAPLVPLALFSAPLASVDGCIKTHRWTDRGWKWPSALNTGAELQSIRLSHFDSTSSLNCSVNLAAALSCLTYWSPESVLRVLCPTNRLFCPPSSPPSLSTWSDRPAMMIRAPSPLSPAPQVPNHHLISSIYYHVQIQQSAADERKLHFLPFKILKLFSVDFFCKQTLKLVLDFNAFTCILDSSLFVNNIQGHNVIWFIKIAVGERKSSSKS